MGKLWIKTHGKTQDTTKAIDGEAHIENFQGDQVPLNFSTRGIAMNLCHKMLIRSDNKKMFALFAPFLKKKFVFGGL